MQILKSSYEFPPLGGGGAKVVMGIARRLAARGHRVDVVTMAYRGLAAHDVVEGINVSRVPGVRMRLTTCSFIEMVPYVLFAPWRIIRLARSGKYSFSHVHFIYPDGMVAWLVKRFTGLPYIITAHGSDVPGYNPNRFRFLHVLLKPVWRVVTNDASLIICPSSSIETLIKASNPKARTEVIPNGIELDRFQQQPKERKRVLAVTRMFERKGVQFLIEALQGMSEDLDVHIVGDGPYLAHVQDLAKQLNVHAKFWGYLDNDSAELRNLYETASIFVFTSEAENFPIVLLEAMASRAAIITTSGTGCAEVVGDAALLVPSRDAEAIRSALKRLAADPELVVKLGEAARARVVAQFGWDRVIEDYLKVYARFASATAANNPP
ncbi:MAG TPA: glycosyltransferase family 4 protein [Steroidobacteraceae bacterium]|nr:glycosyltransferase family 4 protein [Steroidobacteraceae bacterium]